ncbi:hypothetical protein JOQ06_019942 [Pogonophryne albipinna]|uniref:Sex hormone-binding globulin n=1 Tax=Pogonophryne albipinna TaxID=1090488 RepID=A0AAD6FW14_9TELE|nr:hypothetical protein JOQ06_019942 [Pogonophryne albipinna]
MAVFWKPMAAGLLLTVSLTLLGWGVEAQGGTQAKKVVSGEATVYLGQDRDIWRPIIHTASNLSDISSIKSTFQLRTFDPEGAIFYGDTKNGDDWFVLGLKDGLPLMQFSIGGNHVSAEGGPQLNDGKWHKLEVSNQKNFVILDVDGSKGLVVGMGGASKQTEEVQTGELRLALGGILIDKEKMMIQFDPKMDGCVREGSWLNLRAPWEVEVEELWPCYQDIIPGSFFPGTGFAVFNTSVFPVEEGKGVKIEFQGNFTLMHGTILSIRAPGQEMMLTLMVDNNTQEVTLTFGSEKISMKSDNFKKLVITFEEEMLQVLQVRAKFQDLQIKSVRNSGFLTTWRNGHIAFGGLLGEGEDNVGSQFLTGCLEMIQVMGRDLDLDFTVKHPSIVSHSCPA